MNLFGSDLGITCTGKFKYLESGVESAVEGVLLEIEVPLFHRSQAYSEAKRNKYGT